DLTPGTLFCADDLPVKKPAPEPLWAAAEELSTHPDRCWYIGDHVRDMQAARAAGMVAVAVGYGYIEEGEDYRQWPADLWFETCEELVEALLQMAYPWLLRLGIEALAIVPLAIRTHQPQVGRHDLLRCPQRFGVLARISVGTHLGACG